VKIFTDARVRSIVFFGFVRYLPTLELEIFMELFTDARVRNMKGRIKKGKRENKFLAILDKISNAVCLR
jgi:hypothetical protein